MKNIVLMAIGLGAWMTCAAEQDWWMREPIRWVQTNLRETDAALDPKKFIDQVAAFDANALLFLSMHVVHRLSLVVWNGSPTVQNEVPGDAPRRPENRLR